jgi:hypothetical protein
MGMKKGKENKEWMAAADKAIRSEFREKEGMYSWLSQKKKATRRYRVSAKHHITQQKTTEGLGKMVADGKSRRPRDVGDECCELLGRWGCWR